MITALTTPTSNTFHTRPIAASLRPPVRMKPSDWAETHVTIPSKAAVPGKLEHANAPYLPGMIDMLTIPGVTQVNIRKPAQVGVSEGMRWFLGWLACTDPCPAGLTLPDKDKGRQIISEDVAPFFRRTPPLRMLMTSRTWDLSSQLVRLTNGFILFLMWSGSASSTASHPMRVVVNDEVDKMAKKAGKEAHAVHLTKARLKTYKSRGLQVNVSTPTTRLGMISVLFTDSEIELYFLIPCPHCDTYQTWVLDRMKIYAPSEQEEPDREMRALIVEREEHRTRYQCIGCDELLSEMDRKRMIQRGRWGTADEHGVADGVIQDITKIDEMPKNTSIAVQVPELGVTWVEMGTHAANFIRAGASLSAMFEFRTQHQGLPFETVVDKATPSLFKQRSMAARLIEGVLPWWTSHVLCAIDTQGDYFWYVVRAFGPGMRSQRVAHGRLKTFDDLDELIYRRQWPVEGDRYSPRKIDLACIDTGGTKTKDADYSAEKGTETASRPLQVHAWLLKRQARVRGIKGDSRPKPGTHIRPGQGVVSIKGSSQELTVPIHLLDVHWWQDLLADAITQRVDYGHDEHTGEVIEDYLWQLNQANDDEYNKHMANLTKVEDRDGEQIIGTWEPVTPGARVDLRHCEGYLLALFYLAKLHLLPDLHDWHEQREHARRESKRSKKKTQFNTPDGRPFLASNRN